MDIELLETKLLTLKHELNPLSIENHEQKERIDQLIQENKKPLPRKSKATK